VLDGEQDGRVGEVEAVRPDRVLKHRHREPLVLDRQGLVTRKPPTSWISSGGTPPPGPIM
jgi:hypothetical protein